MPGRTAVEVLLGGRGIGIAGGARLRGGDAVAAGEFGDIVDADRARDGALRTPALALGTSQARSTSVMLPLAIPSAVSRFSSTVLTLRSPGG